MEKGLKTQTESLLTISNGNLSAVLWRNKNGDQVFYKCEKMSVEEIGKLISKEEKPE